MIFNWVKGGHFKRFLEQNLFIISFKEKISTFNLLKLRSFRLQLEKHLYEQIWVCNSDTWIQLPSEWEKSALVTLYDDLEVEFSSFF